MRFMESTWALLVGVRIHEKGYHEGHGLILERCESDSAGEDVFHRTGCFLATVDTGCGPGWEALFEEFEDEDIFIV